MKNITYTERDGIRYPNLTLPEQIDYPLGKYANLRLDFMKKYRRGKIYDFLLRYVSWQVCFANIAALRCKG